MKAAHTPGPWRRDRYGHVVAPDGEDVRFRSLTIAASGSAERIAQAEANTDLIAAAPDLLAALRGVMEIEEERIANSIFKPNAEGLKRIEAGRAAIAKAAGDAQ